MAGLADSGAPAARRRWRRCGGASPQLCAYRERLGSARACLRPPGHAHRRPRHRRQRATAAKKGREVARKAKERAVEPVAHAEGHKEARGQRECGIGELGQPAMVDARGAKRSEERAAVEGVSEEGSGELRRSVLEAQGARRRDREAGTRQRQGRPARAWLPRSWTRVAVRPIQRTGGVHRSEEGGMTF